MRARLVAAAVLLIAAFYVLAARRLPVGIYNDDAANVLLARSISHGSYSFPGGLGAPEEFLPAFPLLLVVPAWLVQPHWNILRAIPFFFAILCLFLTWRLARRFLSDEAAAAAVLLTALNPAFVTFSGLVLPTLPYLALSLALIDAAGSDEGRASFWRLTAGASLAPLLRPQGAVLIGCLALAQWHRRGLRRAGAFLSLAFLPAIAWTVRNHLNAGSSKDYVDTWRGQIAAVGKTPLLERTAHLLSEIFGFAFLRISSTLAVEAVCGAAALLLALYGAATLLNKRDDSRVFVLAAYTGGLVFLHMTWKWIDARYVVPIIPLLWIVIIAAVTSLLQNRRAPQVALLAIFIGLALPMDASFARRGLHGVQFQPETMAWIRENVPASARLASMQHYAVTLLTGRECTMQGGIFVAAPTQTSTPFNPRVGYLHLMLPRAGDEFALTGIPDGYQPDFARWLDTRPELTQAYHNLDEGALIYRMNHL